MVPLAKIQIKDANDTVDAEVSLEKALDIMQQDMKVEKEFGEPILRTADEELFDIIKIIRKRIVEEIKNIIEE